MQKAGRRGGEYREQRQRLGDALPQSNRGTDMWIVRQVAVQRRLIGMVQHIHHVSATNSGRIVQARLIKAARLQILDALRGMFLHVLLGAEDDGPGWTGFDAGGLESYGNPV